jgi:Ca2+-binding RTX toxin-like protein
MNMISTAFPIETDASNKTETLAKKFASVWEKKNLKTARAGGVSLMALSLAACGAEDETPFAQSDIDAATAPISASLIVAQAATAAAQTQAATAVVAQAAAEQAAAASVVALGAAQAQAAAALVAKAASDTAAATATVTAATATAAKETAEAALVVAQTAQATAETEKTAAEASLATAQASLTAATAAKETAEASLAAQNTQITNAGFADVAALVASQNLLANPAAVSIVLTNDATAGINPDTPTMTGADDTITGTDLTFDATDVIVDASTTDSDTITINTATDIAVTPTVINVETANFNSTGTFSSGDTTLAVDVAGFSGTNIFNFGSTGAGSLVAALTVTNADTAHYIASAAVSPTINLAADADADIEMTVGANSNITTTGTADDLTIHGGGFNVTVAASTATEDIVVDGALAAAITANSALGNVSVTATNDSTVSATAALGNVDINVTGTIGVTATAAAGTVTVNNTGATANDDIALTNLTAATTVVATSVGNVSSGGTNMAAAATITVTAAEDSTIDADGVVASQTLNLNAADPEDAEVNFTVNANAVDVINIGGSTAAEVSIVGADLGAGATATTVSTTNSDGASVLLNDNGNADVRNVESTVDLRIGTTFANNTATHADGARFALDVENNMAATPVFTNAVNATASTANDMSMNLYDSNAANGMLIHTGVGLTVTDVQTLNINLGALTYDQNTNDLTGADLESVVVTGSGNFDLGATGITGDATNRVTLDTTALEGNITLMTLDGTANHVNTVNAGGGTDTFTIDGIAGSTGGFNLTTGAGADTINITANGDGATANITINGEAGTDTLSLANGVNTSVGTISLTSVEVINMSGAGASVGSSTVSGQSLIIDETNGGNSVLTVIVEANEVDISGLAFTANMGQAGDSTIINGGANALSQAFTGSSIIDTITGGTGSDVIIGNAGADVLTGGNGDDTINGGAGADAITVSGGRDTVTGGTGVDNIIITAGAGSVNVTDFLAGGAVTDDNFTLTATAGIVAANNILDVTAAINAGTVTFTAIAVNTAIGSGATDTGFIIAANGGDNTQISLTASDAAIETAIAAQLADTTDIAGALLAAEGFLGLIANDANADATADSYFLFEYKADAVGGATASAAVDINLIAISDGLEFAQLVAADLA